MGLEKKFTRICPQCKQTVYHRRKKDCTFFEKRKRICKQCTLKNREKPKEKFACLTCGKEFMQWRSQLANPDTPFCSKRCWYNSGLKSLVGKRFGKLNVIERIRKTNTTYYKCECDCGNIKIITHTNLVNDTTVSCGCFLKEIRYKERKPLDKVIARNVWNIYKRNAKMRSYEWKLEYDDFIKLINDNCFYCGVEKSNLVKHNYKNETVSIPLNGVDRIDNAIGYTKDNCVSCCRTCNNAKGELPLEEFKLWAKRLYEKLNT